MSTTGKEALSPAQLVETLVQAISGFKLEELPPATQTSMVKQCSEMFAGFVVSYTKTKYGTKPAQQLQGIALYDTPELFDKNPDLLPIFADAYDAFIATIQ